VSISTSLGFHIPMGSSTSAVGHTRHARRMPGHLSASLRPFVCPYHLSFVLTPLYSFAFEHAIPRSYPLRFVHLTTAFVCPVTRLYAWGLFVQIQALSYARMNLRGLFTLFRGLCTSKEPSKFVSATSRYMPDELVQPRVSMLECTLWDRWVAGGSGSIVGWVWARWERAAGGAVFLRRPVGGSVHVDGGG